MDTHHVFFGYNIFETTTSPFFMAFSMAFPWGLSVASAPQPLDRFNPEALGRSRCGRGFAWKSASAEDLPWQ